MDLDVAGGSEPLADGMRIAVRVRRDFTVSDATRLLAAARAACLDLNPGAAQDDAAGVVTSAADAIFTLLELTGSWGTPPIAPWRRTPATGSSRADGGRR